MKHSSQVRSARGMKEMGASPERYILVYLICTFLAEWSTTIPTRGEDVPSLSPAVPCFGDMAPGPATTPLAGGTSGITGTQGRGCHLPWSPGRLPFHLLATEEAAAQTTQRNCTALVSEYRKHGYHQSSMRPSLEDRGGNRLPTTSA